MSALNSAFSALPATPRLPALFIGHGNPMNAIEDNAYSRSWHALGETLPTPRAILCVSAHWMTRGTTLAHVAERPKTIHDFGGFPRVLYEQQYAAPGAPDVAQAAMELVRLSHITPDTEWGLDHGAWSVLRHIFPEARIPVYQVSIDWARDMNFHFEFARALRALRNRGVLVLGSGNIVHNLRRSMPRVAEGDIRPFDWAVEFDAWVQARIDDRDYSGLARHTDAGQSALLAVPTPDHYVPLLYAAAVAEPGETVTQIFEQVFYGGISMRTFRIEPR